MHVAKALLLLELCKVVRVEVGSHLEISSAAASSGVDGRARAGTRL